MNQDRLINLKWCNDVIIFNSKFKKKKKGEVVVPKTKWQKNDGRNWSKVVSNNFFFQKFYLSYFIYGDIICIKPFLYCI